MPVTAMRCSDPIVRTKRRTDAHRHAFLTNARVEEARELTGLKELNHLLFESADALHLPEQFHAITAHGAPANRPSGGGSWSIQLASQASSIAFVALSNFKASMPSTTR